MAGEDKTAEEGAGGEGRKSLDEAEGGSKVGS